MKYLVMFCLLLLSLQTYAQQTQNSFYRGAAVLAATNEKHTRKYKNGRTLKIHYYSNGKIVKAKGRLLIDSSKAIELIPYGRKNVVFINTDSVTGISRWYRGDKITLAILAGAGIAVGGLGALLLIHNSDAIGSGTNILGFLLLLTAVADVYYATIAFPIVMASEWISIRSAKKGYRFSVE